MNANREEVLSMVGAGRGVGLICEYAVGNIVKGTLLPPVVSAAAFSIRKPAIFEIARDGGAERGAQHARATRDRFRLVVSCSHSGPASSRGASLKSPDGDD